ncbi:hypothetical protein CB0940_10917 [Cercospora beticola]|uniref:FAD-binding PCMH-type domain-containing protein n=1 Tax=Cercospora beticola TaxID=122368 RepID=A0A2G5HD63_CERBT|nr:hypothetical protein CB0940_10917 [Cercospora beticola]PIA90435.1 hypothetical protein CB0940_10917 [Cercospora beticola]WPB07742.1 hypothetical protein RHO25_012405 [Cercospora beticola]
MGDIVPDTPTALRWSDSNVETPALIVAPENENEVIKAIQQAREYKLKVLVAGGGTAAFVPVTENTLHLSMERFKHIKLDESTQTVDIGGGVLAGQLIQYLDDRGYYTVYPGSNAVGMAGFVLGGGGHHFLGLHGLAVDNVVSFQLITAEGKSIVASQTSPREEAALFQVLRGAGFGYGVITSFRMKVYPLSTLQLAHNQVITRRLVFDGSSICTAARAFGSVGRPPARLRISLHMTRAPANVPGSGQALLILDAMYIGPEDEAHDAFAPLRRDDIAREALSIKQFAQSLDKINEAAEPGDIRGGFKDLSMVAMKELSLEAIREAYTRWFALTEDLEDAKRSFVTISRFDTTLSEQVGAVDDFCNKTLCTSTRDRYTACVIGTCFNKPELRHTSEAYAGYIRDALTKDDERPRRTNVNCMRPHPPLREMFWDGQVAELRRVKEVWDPEDLFWCPWLQDR